MKLLFLTTFNVDVEHEHIFTKNVIKYLARHFSQVRTGDTIEYATINIGPLNELSRIEVETIYGATFRLLRVDKSVSRETQIDVITTFFKEVAPSVIHSNMVEGIDVIAARQAGIPIVLTVHIGGFVCPRSGGNGLLRYDDVICDGVLGPQCAQCIIKDMPFPKVGQWLYNRLHATKMARYFANKPQPVWYLTPLFGADNRLEDRKRMLREYKYAHIVAANEKLVEILRLYVPEQHIHLLPHGVEERKRLVLPPLDGPVKFFVLSRVQYSKGIVEILKAFRGIPHDKYELHIIGDAQTFWTERQYMKKVEKATEGINVISHGRLPNSEIETVISQCHILIHATFCLEIYGINISEVLSMGRGVLASRCGGAEMQVKHGVNGLLFEPHSVEAIRQAVDTVLDNKALIAEFSENAALPLSITDYIPKLSEIYDEIARKH